MKRGVEANASVSRLAASRPSSRDVIIVSQSFEAE